MSKEPDDQELAFMRDSQHALGQFVTRRVEAVRESLNAGQPERAVEIVRVLGATLEMLGTRDVVDTAGALMDAVQQRAVPEAYEELAHLQALGSVGAAITIWGANGPAVDGWRQRMQAAMAEPTVDANHAQTLLALQTSAEPGFLEGVASLFAEHSGRHVDAMFARLGANDAQGFVESVRDLGGLCANVGALRLRALCSSPGEDAMRLCAACATTSLLLTLRLSSERLAVMALLEQLCEGRLDIDVNWRDRLAAAARCELIDDSVIDQLSVLQAQDGFFDRVLELFERTGRERIDKLDVLVRRGNAEEIAAVAHSLKGASANVGGARLSRLCREMRQFADARCMDGCEACIEPLWDAFHATAGYIAKVGGVSRRK